MIAIEDKIILEALEPEKLTSGGVILPDTSNEASDRGKVLHVGPGKSAVSNGTVGEIPMQCEVGDKVFFPKVMGKQVELDDDEYYIIKECEILTIIKENK